MNILVTGGAGYIGSHTVSLLAEQGHEVTVLDNLSNSVWESIRRVEAITGVTITKIEADIRNRELVERVFAQNHFEAVIHFAGLKSVSESVIQPVEYYSVNVLGTLSLLQAMEAKGVHRLIFSSSATVYADNLEPPLGESMPTNLPEHPYGASKVMAEKVLADFCTAKPHWSVISLRYFNPVGAHPSGQIGEDPKGIPANLVPYISQVATGIRTSLNIYGDDYNTPDGTCRRDYIHVMDLANGHLAALRDVGPGYHVFNLGTGTPYSVLDVLNRFQEQSGVIVPHKFVDRRPGDLQDSWADPSLAFQTLGWKAKHGLTEMMRDEWNWRKANPRGYTESK